MKKLPFRFMHLRSLLSVLLLQAYSLSHAQVTEIYTDFGGFWKSTTTTLNPLLPNTDNNVLGFKYNSVLYSTGVNDLAFTLRLIGYTPASFKALPITSIGGTVVGSTYIALGTLTDGVTNGFSTPLPSVRMMDVLTDGANGLNMGSGVTNIPATSLLNFPVSSIATAAITDSKPDILFSQTASPSGAVDSLYFANSSGAVVGNRVAVVWTGVPILGSYSCDLYNLSLINCDAAVITSGSLTNQIKEYRLLALEFSQFGITTGNYANVTKLVLKPGGSSDPAFVAYNTDAFSILSPVILTQPQSQVICPGAGNNVTFSAIALGLGITYQWKKNSVNIPGATSFSYTITGVTAADAGNYEVAVTNSAGSVTSSIAYLNTAITSQPGPATQTIATGNTVVLSVGATNATSFQWKRNGADIGGATAATYTINPLTTSKDGSYTVSVNNSGGSGCANVLSNAAVIVAATTLYSKSTGSLNVPGTWGVATNGTGSSPVDFTRAEHTLNIANQSSPATGGDLTIAGTLDLLNATTTITAGTTLNAARIIRTGTGTLSGTATSSLTVSGVSALYFSPGSQIIKNLTIAAGTVSLNTRLAIAAGAASGVLAVSAGTFNTSDSLTLSSDANGTAIIGTSAGTINGKITIERYMPARRAWRLMAAPVTTTGAQTISGAWQEGGQTSTANLSPGFGTHITGGTIANGFDQSPPNSTSLKYYNGSSWLPIPNTNTVKTTDHSGYMFFVRGNRAYDILTSTPATLPSPTVLRVTGPINQGAQTAKTVAATGYTLLGNPYASPINFSLIVAASTNIKNRFTVWDPQIGGTNGVGSYVLLDWNGSSYTSTPSTALNGIIQAGQAFFAESNNGSTAGSLVINESHKNTATSIIPFGRVAGSGDANIVADLSIVNTDSTLSIADGLLMHYSDSYSNDIDTGDALKFINPNENIAIVCGIQPLTIERRKMPMMDDTLKMRLTGIKNNSYQLKITLHNFVATSLEAFLYDGYLAKATPIKEQVIYPFSITADAVSAAPDRFSIVYKTLPPETILPVSIVQIKAANRNDTAISISWAAINDIQATSYEIQKENISGSLAAMGTVMPKNSADTAWYQFTDTKPLHGNNVYRVKATGKNGQIVYSTKVNVLIHTPAAGISILPNPVTGNTLKVSWPNALPGQYRYSIANTVGQPVAKGVVYINSGQSIATIQLAPKIPHGHYILSVQSGDKMHACNFILK